jgi:hypothetical protein
MTFLGQGGRSFCERSGATGAALILALWWNAGIGALPDQGGRAEATRIQFARGRDSATVRGVLRDDAQREYAFAARKGQRLTLKLSVTPAQSVSVTAKASVGGNLPLDFNSGSTSSVELPEDGDYELSLKRASTTRGRSEYAMTVTIR